MGQSAKAIYVIELGEMSSKSARTVSPKGKLVVENTSEVAEERQCVAPLRRLALPVGRLRPYDPLRWLQLGDGALSCVQKARLISRCAHEMTILDHIQRRWHAILHKNEELL